MRSLGVALTVLHQKRKRAPKLTRTRFRPFFSGNLLRSPLPAELKEMNEWPTFPQLIIKGEFVGGLDVVQEMREAGELQDLVGSSSVPS